jgi:NitT/TauT family transport system ATP-binding protein
MRPKVLLMDEPFAALDEITRFRFNDELLALWRKLKCTVVFVTHSVYEAAYLSTRTLVFSPRPGRVTDEIEFAPPKVRGDFRASTEYAARVRKLSASLAKAMGCKP